MRHPLNPRTAPTDDRGGVLFWRAGYRQRVARVHVDPAPGVCAVDPEVGCGYCIGVPCREPANTDDGCEIGPGPPTRVTSPDHGDVATP